jgi:hypothetical protein
MSTTDTDHPGEHCGYDWCRAHGELCSCPYAAASPHRAEHCRYADDEAETR